MKNIVLAKAKLSSVKSSPLKISKVANSLLDTKVSHSLRSLKFSKLKVSKVLYSLIYSAMSNAENNLGMDIDSLYIHKINIGKSFVLKRFAARGRGKSSSIAKTFSSIEVFLVEKVI